MKNKRRNKILLLSIIVLGISIGFATLATTLKINGISGIGRNTWKIYWDNIANEVGVTPEEAPEITNDGSNLKTVVTWDVNLAKPGDYYEFTVDAVNEGTIDAMITGIESKIDDSSIIRTENGVLVVADPSPVPSFIKYSVTYDDGKEIKLKQALNKAVGNTPTRRTYKIRVEYDINAVTNEMINNQTDVLNYQFSFSVTYGQATKDVIGPVTFQVGDYFTMVPDSTSYTIDVADTGYDEDTQTINPSLLTLWRVIDVKQDGSVDAVSEYVTPETIYFKGVTGFQKYIGTLNKIAQQYQKAGYTSGARAFGYDTQTEIISDTSAFDGSIYYAAITTQTPTPETGTGVEYNDGVGGDTLYLKDFGLLANVYTDTATYGSLGLKSTKPSGEESQYWLASRRYYYYTGGRYFGFEGRAMNDAGYPIEYTLRSYASGWLEPYGQGWSMRPIITLTNGTAEVAGHGVKDDPYVFE